MAYGISAFDMARRRARRKPLSQESALAWLKCFAGAPGGRLSNTDVPLSIVCHLSAKMWIVKWVDPYRRGYQITKIGREAIAEMEAKK